MGSSHFGELNLAGGRSGSSRKGKRNTSEKAKQPQRGLGVAQLEKIRLQSQMADHLPSLHSLYHTDLPNEEYLGREMIASPSPSSSSTTISSSSVYGFNPNFMMGYGDTERVTNIRFDEFPSNYNASYSNAFIPYQSIQPTAALPLLDQNLEDPGLRINRRHDRRHSTGSFSQNSDSNEPQEPDLDLKLSL